ncbi:hypothetical protein ACFW81_07485 [Streptomyces angustmyceticus]|uniref:hypothetical protein n=1 Tax=Streptomyces angustmyceticus TaxID=285578 RepID=UPI0021AE5BB5|nr:hypothetical protein [Streptomyces angustmyceticus]
MTRGLCTAAVALTSGEIKQLDDLPGAVNEVLEADGCSHLAGHPGSHAFEVQSQDVPGRELVTWWVVWDGPEQPDSTGYEIVALDSCEAEPEDGVQGMETCRLPADHLGEHRW